MLKPLFTIFKVNIKKYNENKVKIKLYITDIGKFKRNRIKTIILILKINLIMIFYYFCFRYVEISKIL